MEVRPTQRAIAHSISQPVRERLCQLHRSQGGRFGARVLGIFERACDLVTDDGDVVALVTPQVGNGPLNIVVGGAPGIFAGIDADAPVVLALEGERLWVGELEVDLEEAAVWEPRPDWDLLRARLAAVTSCLSSLRALCRRFAPADSLLALLEHPPCVGTSACHPPNLCLKPLSRGRHVRREAASQGAFADHATPVPGAAGHARTAASTVILPQVLPRVRGAVEALRESWRGDLERLREGTIRLAGLGGGLTPAGDDFLAGAMVWAWLAHPAPQSFCHAVVEAAAPRTTVLAAALLRAAARGECSAPWHALLAALSGGLSSEGAEARIAAAVQQVLACGATSGADALAGFLEASETSASTPAHKPACPAPRP